MTYFRILNLDIYVDICSDSVWRDRYNSRHFYMDWENTDLSLKRKRKH